jgi:antitoxin (DNA-binding transcriptional repressor) of toxin-antitoxin stability system
MTHTVKVGETETCLSDLLARVEAGEEIVIARGDAPIAKLTRIEKPNDLAAVLAEARCAGSSEVRDPGGSSGVAARGGGGRVSVVMDAPLGSSVSSA